MDFAILFHPWILIFIFGSLLALAFASGHYLFLVIRSVFSGYHRIPDPPLTGIGNNTSPFSWSRWIDSINGWLKHRAFRCALRLTDVKYSITEFFEDTPTLLLTSPSGTDLPLSTVWQPLVGYRPRIPDPWLLNTRWRPCKTPWLWVSFSSGLKRLYPSWEAIPVCAKVRSDIICEPVAIKADTKQTDKLREEDADEVEDRAREWNREQQVDSVLEWIADVATTPQMYTPISVLPTLVSQWTEPKPKLAPRPRTAPFWLVEQPAPRTTKKGPALFAGNTVLKKADFQRMLAVTRVRSASVPSRAPTTQREPTISRRFSLPGEDLRPTVNWERRDESRIKELRELARTMFAPVPAPQSQSQSQPLPLSDYSPKPVSIPVPQESAPVPVLEDSAIFTIGSCDSLDGAVDDVPIAAPTRAAVVEPSAVIVDNPAAEEPVYKPVIHEDASVFEPEYEYAAVLFSSPALDSKAPFNDDSGFFSIGSLDSLADSEDDEPLAIRRLSLLRESTSPLA
ncbi:hypothetical protein GLOTRDRAFT_126077 [Gloeophyllum trabeum ATCC 11539]|uniref:Uncharacterized protein n=1 Tax=Gloeophyllum trabeum (strain ATCC 11539 / FP-39264 / Madison 617) TaxID=670483 RepID=S7RXW1_GLOTA|nr:uncharacterized protein GLOTRDRAFT_126077 [Gloeophyllum trabeum ATCC 11539]EPQ59780.1 hypothetical protein GLOTRDRAFT_126077 [Gloeophyllum trabeum ATCC 11539]